MKKIFNILFLILCFGRCVSASAGEHGWWSDWLGAMKRTADDPTSYSVYRPVSVYHMRWNYEREAINRYNETPRGLGFGVSRVEGYSEHSLYFVGFSDSNYHFQGAFGYGRIYNIWRPGNFLNMGGGFTISAQMRSEYNHIPIPIPLPLASVDFGPFSMQAAYVPGWRGMGNVAIFQGKLRIRAGERS